MFILSGGSSLQLAPQELVDCKADQSERDGCNGGNPMQAYEVIAALGGMELETDYPYQGQNEQCRFSRSNTKVTASDGGRLAPTMRRR